MNEIQMIRTEMLQHHPENPRLDLGDLTELTESIRQNGIMQNLTVVAGHMMTKDEYVAAARAEGVSKVTAEDAYRQMTAEDRWASDGYTVVIGNRRLEAAKLAGLEALPCVISDMDHKTQVATMLMENMQRQDLTVYEQAKGFQMMMDLGFSGVEICEKTGFSETTVRRRIKMAELDPELLKAKCAQLTMDDIDMLNKIRDVKKRNEILKDAGTSNFKWNADSALTEQKRSDNYKLVRDILLQAGCIEKDTRGIDDFWNKYELLPYDAYINLDNYKAGTNILPKDDRQLFFHREWSSVKFWAEKRKQKTAEGIDPDEDETEEDTEEKREATNAWEKLQEIERHMKESRAAFIEGMTVKQKHNRKALEWMIIGLCVSYDPGDGIGRLLPDVEDEDLEALPKGHTETDLDLKWVREQIETNPQFYGQILDGMFFDGQDSVQNRWQRNKKPEYCRNLCMITGYEWLEEFGYPVSDEERGYLDGTLDCYRKEEE